MSIFVNGNRIIFVLVFNFTIPSGAPGRKMKKINVASISRPVTTAEQKASSSPGTIKSYVHKKFAKWSFKSVKYAMCF